MRHRRGRVSRPAKREEFLCTESYSSAVAISELAPKYPLKPRFYAIYYFLEFRYDNETAKA